MSVKISARSPYVVIVVGTGRIPDPMYVITEALTGRDAARIVKESDIWPDGALFAPVGATP